jgi:O-methyltransferase domain
VTLTCFHTWVHDWDEAHSVKLLRNLRSAAAPGGRVLIVDVVLPGANEPSPAKLMDLQCSSVWEDRSEPSKNMRRWPRKVGSALRAVPTASPVSSSSWSLFAFHTGDAPSKGVANVNLPVNARK